MAVIPPVAPPTVAQTETITPLVPDYIYTTDQSVEDFGSVESGNNRTSRQAKNDLTSPSPVTPSCSGYSPFANPKNPATYDFCKKNPQDSRCNDECDPYSDLALFQEFEKNIFDPEKRTDKVKATPIQTKYESKQDDTQFDPPTIIRQECRCKDGKTALGYLDTTTGQKDCSACNSKTRRFSNPSPYKNYKTKRPQTNFRDKKVPLREQVGVSHLGDVDLQGCQTGTTTRSIEVINQNATLNKITNIDRIDDVGGSKVTTDPIPVLLKTGMPKGYSLYDECKTNVYGI